MSSIITISCYIPLRMPKLYYILDPRKHGVDTFYYENFEGAERGGRNQEKGYRETNDPAYCGRKYLKVTDLF